MKIVFFGTPPFAAEVLSYLLKNEVDVVAVVTRPDKPKGRSKTLLPTPVKTVALNQDSPIPVFQPAKVSAPEFADVLPPFEADLFVVVAYGEIIKQHVLDIPRMGCINLHASLLPKYRGAAPIQRCIISGETETGVTIMHMVRKMDAGDIIKTVTVPIGPNETFGELEKKLCQVGSPLFLEVIREFEKGQIKETSQDETQVTYAPKIALEDCEIDWNLPAQEIHHLIRGVNPYPGAWCNVLVKGVTRKMKVHITRLERDRNGTPGEILSCDSEGMVVGCGEGALRVLELQVEGKRVMTPEELLRGTSITINLAL